MDIDSVLLPISKLCLPKGHPKGMKCLDSTNHTLLILLVQTLLITLKKRETTLSISATLIYTTSESVTVKKVKKMKPGPVKKS